MKILLRKTTILIVLLTPFYSFCSYMTDSENARYTKLTYLYENERGYQKCLLLIDMIKDTKDSAKKKQLQTILEVELLTLMDHFLYQIERTEINLAGQLKAFEESSSEKDAVFWSVYVLESQKKIADLQLEREKIRVLLKHSI